MFKKYLLIFIFIFGSALTAHAEVVGETVEYKDGETVLEGYLAYDNATENQKPGVLVVHEWTGLGDYAKSRANQLAELGYVAFAADIYGKGVRPEAKDAGAEASKYKNNRPLMRQRAQVALKVLTGHPLVNSAKIAAIGYCFGGTTVLELARSGVEMKGVVSFHGGLSTPDTADAKNIKTKILVLHGADDPHVPKEEVAGFEKEMKDAGVDMRFIAYPGAVHAFTNPSAGNDNSKGAAYNAEADAKSWEDMKQFFAEILV